MEMRRTRMAVLLLSAISAHHAYGADQAQETSPTPSRNLYVTPLSQVSTDWSEGGMELDVTDFSDSYTRLLVTGKLIPSHETNDPRTSIYDYRPRRALSRALLSSNHAVNLTARVSAGSFEATIPLATISHISGSKGEKWSREIHHSKDSFPLFLVSSSGSSSSPTIRISVNGDRTFDSGASAIAVQVALGVAKATGYSTPVVTTLTERELLEQSRAIDEAISRLFSSSISEDHWVDRDLKSWRWKAGERTASGVKVQFSIPKYKENWSDDRIVVGDWTLTFDHPRPSVFSDWRICGSEKLPKCARTKHSAQVMASGELNAAAILNYPIAGAQQGLGSIRSFISQKSWYSSGMIDLATIAISRNAPSLSRAQHHGAAAASICRSIVNEMTAIGLSGFDADAVVWAISEGMPLPPDVVLTHDAACEQSIAKIRRLRTIHSELTLKGEPLLPVDDKAERYKSLWIDRRLQQDWLIQIR